MSSRLAPPYFADRPRQRLTGELRRERSGGLPLRRARCRRLTTNLSNWYRIGETVLDSPCRLNLVTVVRPLGMWQHPGSMTGGFDHRARELQADQGLAHLPFPGAVYCVAHGENIRVADAIADRQSLAGENSTSTSAKPSAFESEPSPADSAGSSASSRWHRRSFSGASSRDHARERHDPR